MIEAYKVTIKRVRTQRIGVMIWAETLEGAYAIAHQLTRNEYNIKNDFDSLCYTETIQTFEVIGSNEE